MPAGHPEIPLILDGLKDLHAEKAKAYGTVEEVMQNFNNVSRFNKRPNYLYAMDRIVEKLTRAYNLERAGRLADVEEELLDICLLAALAEAMRRDTIKERHEIWTEDNTSRLKNPTSRYLADELPEIDEDNHPLIGSIDPDIPRKRSSELIGVKNPTVGEVKKVINTIIDDDKAYKARVDNEPPSRFIDQVTKGRK